MNKNTPCLFFHSSSPILMSEILLKPKNYLELWSKGDGCKYGRPFFIYFSARDLKFCLYKVHYIKKKSIQKIQLLTKL